MLDLDYRVYMSDGNIMMFSSDSLIEILKYIEEFYPYSVRDIIKIELIEDKWGEKYA